MRPSEFLRAFIDDCRYYDPLNREITTILRYVDVQNKTILDIGTGIGRLAYPISRTAKEVIALDNNPIFREYFKKHSKANVTFVHADAKTYLRQQRNFDIILLAWPPLDFKLLNILRKSLQKNSVCVFITCDNTSDWETIVDKIGVNARKFEDDIMNKQKFLQAIPTMFTVLVKKKINTSFEYPSANTAFRIIKSSLHLWFDIELNSGQTKKLKLLIEQHQKDEKIVFGERIWFYILKKRG